MASTRVLVVSDTHLSSRTPEALANWDAVVDHVAAGGHDLVLHVGDVTVDGAGDADRNGDRDLDVARAQLARLGARLRVVPGNHDIGDNPVAGVDGVDGGHESPVSPDRLDLFRAALGPDRWSLDLPGWRLVGIDCLLFGSGLDEEAAQWSWLAATLGDRGGRRVALVVHKPLAPPPPGDDVAPHRYVPAEHRDSLLGLVPPGEPALVVSGHVHQYAQHVQDGTRHLWVPTTWAVIPDRIQRTLGEKRCGVVELTLHDDGRAEAAPAYPEGLAHQVLLETVASPYDI